jgi:hypothetical protein
MLEAGKADHGRLTVLEADQVILSSKLQDSASGGTAFSSSEASA